MSTFHDPNAAPVTSEPGGTTEAVPAGHDTAPPPALVDFMVRDWMPGPADLPAAIPLAEVFAGRRRALSRLFPSETLIIPTGHEKQRSNDTFYRFRPGTDFFYLTGNVEPDCVLVMLPEEGGGHRDVLYVEPNPGRADATFYTDRKKGELWVGPRLGVEQSRARFGVDECRGLPELDGFLGSLRAAKGKGQGKAPRVLRRFSPAIDRQIPDQAERDEELAAALSELRLIKDAHEVGEIQGVIDATHRGFEDVIRALRDGGTERHVEGVFNLRARVEGNDVGYGTIAASGSHACVLHWTRNDGALVDGQLLLLDAGIEGHSLYTADITRTIPINGRYSPAQREIYDLVRAAQKAALGVVKPGADFMAPNKAAMVVLAEGLERLGILASARHALLDENQFYKRYTLHNVSHMLGLDVHDCASARAVEYKFGTLKPGMVLTVEPGLYFQTDDLTVPPRYRGIGVRIEDDILVTDDGMRNLSEAIPADSDEVEAWMARIWG